MATSERASPFFCHIIQHYTSACLSLTSEKRSAYKSHYQNFEPPFEIPDSWEWAQVKDISSSILYGISESAKSQGEYKFLRITDIQDNNVNWENVPYTDFDKNKASQYILENGDIVFARTGATVGKSYLVESIPSNSIYASYLIRIRTNEEILPEYLKIFFESTFYWHQIFEGAVGIGQPNVNGTSLGLLWLPIPPRNEQQRIVSNTKDFTLIVSSMEYSKKAINKSITQIKSKILELAMQGKLVPQDPTDEPAADMLRRVNPKAKIITDTPHSWNIPETWCWCQLGDLFNHNTGKALNSSKQDGQEYEYITTSNVYWDRFELDFLKKMFYKDSEIDKCRVVKGDLLVCEGGDVGRSAIWNMDFPIMIQNHLHRLRPVSEGILASLYLYLFKLYKGKELIGGKGIALQGFSSNTLHKLVVPCIPKNEQKRIVAKIEELYSVLDKIEASLQS